MFFKTTYQRKSFVLTTLLVIVILLLFSFVSLKFLDPPIEYGMEVNFGSSSNGFGNELNNKNDFNLNDEPTEKKQKIEEKTFQKNEMINTNDKEKNLTINNKKNDSLRQVDNSNGKVVSTYKTEEQKISDYTKSILSNLNNQIDNKNKIKGQGENNNYFDQGTSEGNPYSTIYYGQRGKGGEGVGYGLNGRNLQFQGKKVPECNEYGKVVVRIEVNQTGDVISAKPGVKGTTNNHPCLLKPAKETALMHKWFPDKNAPKKQIGFVVIQFKIIE